MANPLFSTYTQGENRVISTLIAVLENINNQLTEDLLEAVLDESDLSLVTFENQLVGDRSVPDAGIRSSTSTSGWCERTTKPRASPVSRPRARRTSSAPTRTGNQSSICAAATPEVSRRAT